MADSVAGLLSDHVNDDEEEGNAGHGHGHGHGAAAAATAGGGHGHGGHQPGGPSSPDADADGDVLLQAFIACDVDGSGQIDLEELHAMLNALGCHISEDKARELMRTVEQHVQTDLEHARTYHANCPDHGQVRADPPAPSWPSMQRPAAQCCYSMVTSSLRSGIRSRVRPADDPKQGLGQARPCDLHQDSSAPGSKPQLFQCPGSRGPGRHHDR